MWKALCGHGERREAHNTAAHMSSSHLPVSGCGTVLQYVDEVASQTDERAASNIQRRFVDTARAGQSLPSGPPSRNWQDIGRRRGSYRRDLTAAFGWHAPETLSTRKLTRPESDSGGSIFTVGGQVSGRLLSRVAQHPQVLFTGCPKGHPHRGPSVTWSAALFGGSQVVLLTQGQRQRVVGAGHDAMGAGGAESELELCTLRSSSECCKIVVVAFLCKPKPTIETNGMGHVRLFCRRASYQAALWTRHRQVTSPCMG